MAHLDDHLKELGFQTHSVCLYGHGTSSKDLAKASWEHWLKNVEDGYHQLRKNCKKLFFVGFSMGGCLSLILSSKPGTRIDGLVVINPCMGIRAKFNFMVPWAVKWNEMMDKFGWNSFTLKYVDSGTELPSINYKRNSLHGTNELKKLMVRCWQSLDKVLIPCLVIQERNDPTVLYKSGEKAFNKISSTSREFISTNLDVHATMYLECCRGVIFEMVDKFIKDTRECSFKSIAHRGASGKFTENTLAAFNEAIDCGCDMIELDVQRIGSKLRVFHDHDFQRMFGRDTHTRDISEEDVVGLTYPNLEKIPTLEEALECIDGRVDVNIEIKGSHIATNIAVVARKYLSKPSWKDSDIILSSFSQAEINMLRHQYADMSLSYLLYEQYCNLEELKRIKPHYFERNIHSINLPMGEISEEIVTYCNDNNIRIYVYTANELKEIRYLRELGVNGVFTDYPSRIQ